MYFFSVIKREDNYFAINNNRYFKITEITYKILASLLENKQHEQIIHDVNLIYNTSYDLSFLNEFLNSTEFKKLNCEVLKKCWI